MQNLEKLKVKGQILAKSYQWMRRKVSFRRLFRFWDLWWMKSSEENFSNFHIGCQGKILRKNKRIYISHLRLHHLFIFQRIGIIIFIRICSHQDWLWLSAISFRAVFVQFSCSFRGIFSSIEWTYCMNFTICLILNESYASMIRIIIWS